MLYKLNGKNVKIPDAEIDKLMKFHNLSKNEAIQLYLEDEGLIKNDEVEKLSKQAKTNKIKHEAYTNKSKQKRERKPKEDTTKENLISSLYKFLTYCQYENVTIENKTKIITFSIGDEKYKLDLIRQRGGKS